MVLALIHQPRSLQVHQFLLHQLRFAGYLFVLLPSMITRLSLSICTVATAGLLALAAQAQDEVEESFIPNYTAGSLYGSWTDNAALDGEGSLASFEFASNADLPVIMSDNLKLTAGFRYRFNQFDFDATDTILASQSLDLHRLELPTNLWLNHDRWKFWLRLQPGIMSDFEEVDSNAFTVTALALAAYQITDKVTVAGGVYFSQDLGDDTILPAVGLIWRPSNQWTLSLTAPRFQIAFAPTKKWLLTLNAYPSGGSWNIEDPDGDGQADLNHSAVRAGFGIDHRIGETPAWVFLDAGLQFLQELELDDSAARFDRDLDEAAFVNFGLKLRF